MKMAGIPRNKWASCRQRPQVYKTVTSKTRESSRDMINTGRTTLPPTANSKHRRAARRTEWPSAKILRGQGGMTGNQGRRNREVGDWRAISAQRCHSKARYCMKMWKSLGIIYRLPLLIIISNINLIKNRDHIIITPRSRTREMCEMTSRPCQLTLADLSAMGEIVSI